MGPVLLLHGFLGSGEDFAPLRALLRPGRETEAPDWPGHGTLGALREPREYGLEAHLRPVAEWAARQAGPATLLGYSMGGRLLQHALLALPPLPADWRVVLVSASPGIADAAEAADRRAGDAAAARLLRDRGVAPFLRYWHSQTMFRPLLALPPARLGPILARRAGADAEGLALSLEHVGPGSLPPTARLAPTLRCRLDIVAGELDGRYVGHARAMAEAAPGARLHLVAGAGHAIHLERPDALAAILGD